VYGASFLQEYWWINGLTVYDSVNPLIPGDVSDNGKYEFESGTYIDSTLSGYYTQSGINGYNYVTTCVAPVVAPTGLGYNYPQNVKFWVIATGCCYWYGRSGNGCIAKYGWDNRGPTYVGYTHRMQLATKQANAPRTLVISIHFYSMHHFNASFKCRVSVLSLSR
jgi:hypothetical protein